MTQAEKVLRFGRYAVKITHADKVLFPEDQITKLDVAEYYHRIAKTLVRFARDRPISMQRFPEGIGEPGFFQKEASDFFPEFIERVRVPLRETGEVKEYVCINNSASLVYLANLGAITTHLWLSKRDKLEYPDRMIFDLDPEKVEDFSRVITIARGMQTLCDELGLHAYPMTTGSKGIHVVIPLVRRLQFSAVKAVARQIAEVIVHRFPDDTTLELRKDKRHGKIYMDVLRNEYAQTAVAPYSIRPIRHAPIATPLSWDEINTDLHPQQFHINNIFQRLAGGHDPWRPLKNNTLDIQEIKNRTGAMSNE